MRMIRLRGSLGVLAVLMAYVAGPAAAVPHDVVFVVDLSVSTNDESRLRSYKLLEIPNRAVWQWLWDNALAQSLGTARPFDGGDPAGPLLGNMNAWGTAITGPGWDFAQDPGLVRLPKTGTWVTTGAYISQTLNAQGYGTYTAGEVSAINATPSSYRNGDNATTYYRRRVRVALGLDRWTSGKTGGQAGGNADGYIDAGEVVSMIPYPSDPANPTTLCKQVGGSWDSFVDYVSTSIADMCTAEAGLQYRFGLKTFVDFLQVEEAGDATSPGLGGAPEEPIGTAADGVRTVIAMIQNAQADDRIGMAAFGTIGYGPGDQPDNLSWLTVDSGSVLPKVDTLQAEMWTRYSNLAQGIDKGADILFNSPMSRPNAAKIMIVLTNSYPNQTLATPASDTGGHSPCYYPSQAQADAVARAAAAAVLGVRMYTIRVGQTPLTPDLQEWLNTLAAAGGGSVLVASSDRATYHAQLQGMLLQVDPCAYDPDPSDSDGDGVHDACDVCPNTPPGARVNPVGCTPADLDADGDVDLLDFSSFRACFNGPNRVSAASGCGDADLDQDGDVDLSDFVLFRTCFNGSNHSSACPG